MSTISGEIPILNLPLPPLDTGDAQKMSRWFILVQLNISQWASAINIKLAEIESVSVNGQGINLPMYAPGAGVSKRNGVIVMFNSDPNAAGGPPGLYRYNSSTSNWDKV